MDDFRPMRPQRPVPPRPQQPVVPKPPVMLPTIKPLELLPERSLSLSTNRKRWFWLILIGVICLVIVGTIIAGFSWYGAALQPRSGTISRIRITVVAGDTADTIGKKLEQNGAIRSAVAFSLYAKQSGTLNDLKAGTYLFSPTQSVQQIMQWIVDGKVDTFNVTILPGQTLTQIKSMLIKYGFMSNDIDAAFAKSYDTPLLKYKPSNVNLEGYIFPDTYTITSQTTVEQLLGQSFGNFYNRIQQTDLEAALSARGFNLHQAITLASVIQLEASTASDRRQVAQVFEKRLQTGMALGSDVTYMYAAHLLQVTPSVDIDSPYNTRKYGGLPPGAIANFTLDALQAVANPAAGNYVYFVAGDNGKLYFAQTEAEHQQNIQLYCKKLCQ